MFRITQSALFQRSEPLTISSHPLIVAALLSGIVGCSIAPLEAAPPPDVVKQAGALNTGGTSFFDGFGRLDEGVTFNEYIAVNTADRISDYRGNSNPAFNNPRFDNLVTLHQLIYTSDWHPFGGVVGFSTALPAIDFNTHFDTPGTVLQNNGLGIGDITWGPTWQSQPVLNDTGRTVFSYRFQMQIISPTGAFDSTKSLNQGSGFWVINPYVAFSWLPAEDLEFSARVHYVYNLRTDAFSAPPKIPGLIYRYGQAGTAGFFNFASSYKVSDSAYLGVNGFYFQQFNNDSVNGIESPNSRQQYLFVGPGARYVFDNDNFVNFNVYLPVTHYNVTTGPRYNLMLTHRF
jgi:hypothetical protein